MSWRSDHGARLLFCSIPAAWACCSTSASPTACGLVTPFSARLKARLKTMNSKNTLVLPRPSKTHHNSTKLQQKQFATQSSHHQILNITNNYSCGKRYLNIFHFWQKNMYNHDFVEQSFQTSNDENWLESTMPNFNVLNHSTDMRHLAEWVWRWFEWQK